MPRRAPRVIPCTLRVHRTHAAHAARTARIAKHAWVWLRRRRPATGRMHRVGTVVEACAAHARAGAPSRLRATLAAAPAMAAARMNAAGCCTCACGARRAASPSQTARPAAAVWSRRRRWQRRRRRNKRVDRDASSVALGAVLPVLCSWVGAAHGAQTTYILSRVRSKGGGEAKAFVMYVTFLHVK